MKKEIRVFLGKRCGLLTAMLLLAANSYVIHSQAEVVPVVVSPPEPMVQVRGRTPDDDIALNIYRAFYYDPRVVSAFTRVDVTNGVATLSGSVPTLESKAWAEQLASRTPGVVRVVDLLDVVPLGPAYSDEEIYRNVRHAFSTDPQVSRRTAIQVGVVSGRVYLSGPVDTIFMRAKAANLAGEVPGVVGVENALTVPQGHHIYDDGVPGGSYPKHFVPDDKQVRKNIDQRFRATPLLPGERVHVEVHDRVVTLTGTVASEQERNLLVHDAYSAGAKEVRDELQVAPTIAARQP